MPDIRSFPKRILFLAGKKYIIQTLRNLNLLQHHFSFVQPNEAWVGDITYIPTDEGWLYCAIVKDLCLKKVVGYAFSEHIDTSLTLAALDMAVLSSAPQRA